MSDKLKKIVKKEILEKQIGGKGILGPAAAPANSPPFGDIFAGNATGKSTL